MHLKLFQKEQVKKTAEKTGDLFGNKITDKTRKISRISPQNSSKTVESETKTIGLDRETPREKKYIYIQKKTSSF